VRQEGSGWRNARLKPLPALPASKNGQKSRCPSVVHYGIVYNAFSVTLAAMMAATLFFWFGRSQVLGPYKTAMTVAGLVTFIASYHYLQILISWMGAYTVVNGVITETGVPFNEALRYSDWLLTVPLLLVELVIVMNLGTKQTSAKVIRLGSLAALMIALGLPGQLAETNSVRFFWGALSMVPFLMIIYELLIGLREAINRQPAKARILVMIAIYVTILSWTFYPVVYFAGGVLMSDAASVTAIQIGYTISDLIAKVGYGVLIYNIALRKSEADLNALANGNPANATSPLARVA
jgi:bacteriorhodopsin